MLSLLHRLAAAVIAYPPRPRARAEVTPAAITYLPAKKAPATLEPSRGLTHRGEISNECREV